MAWHGTQACLSYFSRAEAELACPMRKHLPGRLREGSVWLRTLAALNGFTCDGRAGVTALYREPDCAAGLVHLLFQGRELPGYKR